MMEGLCAWVGGCGVGGGVIKSWKGMKLRRGRRDRKPETGKLMKEVICACIIHPGLES